MPKNNSLKPVNLPMVKKFDKTPETEFINNLDSIQVSLVSAPTLEHLRHYIPYYTGATWAESPYKKVTAEAAYGIEIDSKGEIILRTAEGTITSSQLYSLIHNHYHRVTTSTGNYDTGSPLGV